MSEAAIEPGQHTGRGSVKTLGVEAADRIEEIFFWGGLLAYNNTSLTKAQIYAIGNSIIRYSRYYGLPKRLIVAIIIVESNGDLHAVSSKGAMGLMQVAPIWLQKIEPEENLFEIDTNIRIGCQILADNIKKGGYKEGLLRYYRGNMAVLDDSYFYKVERTMNGLMG